MFHAAFQVWRRGRHGHAGKCRLELARARDVGVDGGTFSERVHRGDVARGPEVRGHRADGRAVGAIAVARGAVHLGVLQRHGDGDVRKHARRNGRVGVRYGLVERLRGLVPRILRVGVHRVRDGNHDGKPIRGSDACGRFEPEDRLDHERHVDGVDVVVVVLVEDAPRTYARMRRDAAVRVHLVEDRLHVLVGLLVAPCAGRYALASAHDQALRVVADRHHHLHAMGHHRIQEGAVVTLCIPVVQMQEVDALVLQRLEVVAALAGRSRSPQQRKVGVVEIGVEVRRVELIDRDALRRATCTASAAGNRPMATAGRRCP